MFLLFFLSFIQVYERDTIIEQLNSQISAMQKQIAMMEQEIHRMKSVIDGLEREKRDLENQLRAANQRIKVCYVDAIYFWNSVLWVMFESIIFIRKLVIFLVLDFKIFD